MTTQNQKIVALAQAIGADIKTIKKEAGALGGLFTNDKTSLVAAINELKSSWAVGTTASEDFVTAAVAALRTELTNGADSALDTFKELADAIGNDATFAQTLATNMSKKVGVTEQSFTAEEKAQILKNIGIGEDTDFVTTYTTARDSE